MEGASYVEYGCADRLRIVTAPGDRVVVAAQFGERAVDRASSGVSLADTLTNMDALSRLADLLRRRNEIDADIANVIGRPAERGHVGEFIAAAVFDIALHDSATHAGSDGVFRSGRLAGRSVNVKLYGAQEALLDVKKEHAPDIYLVLTGPVRAAMSSRGLTRPLVIQHVYVFEHAALVGAGVKPGVAASVRKALWAAAEVWPGRGDAALLDVTPAQAASLELFR
jgi:hypothetical protein